MSQVRWLPGMAAKNVMNRLGGTNPAAPPCQFTSPGDNNVTFEEKAKSDQEQWTEPGRAGQ